LGGLLGGGLEGGPGGGVLLNLKASAGTEMPLMAELCWATAFDTTKSW
jgi:hypothetical protein